MTAFRDTADAEGLNVVNFRFAIRTFQVFAAMAILSVGISLGGKWVGRSIAMGGHTDDKTVREVVIGNNVIAAPANMIRFERARQDGVARKLDLYLLWPGMTGYSVETRDEFNHAGGRRNILFLSFDESIMSRDMSGRFEPIYKPLIEPTGRPGPSGLKVFDFTKSSGYVDEMLVVGALTGKPPFVARCLTGATADESLAPCERDVHVGDGLSLTYRFPRELLARWPALDRAVIEAANRMLKTAK